MISKYSVKKPYTVLVGVLLVIVLGIVSLTKMTTDLLPDMSLQYALIITTDVGASPEKVEMEVTAPIESAIATTTGIKNVTSMSYNSYSIVTCEYDDSVNMDSVVIEIQQNLDQLSGYWGDNVGSPMIMKINPDMLPVMNVAVDVEGMSALEITEYVDTELIPALESLEGVASASASGMLEETVMVTLDPIKIQAINDLVQKEIKGEFKKPQAEINDAKNKLQEGKNAISDGGDQLSEAFTQATEGKSALLKAESELTKQLEQLKEQKTQLQAALVAMQSALGIREGMVQGITETEAQIKELGDVTIPDLEEKERNLDSLKQAKDSEIEALERELAGYTEGTEEYRTTEEQLNQARQERVSLESVPLRLAEARQALEVLKSSLSAQQQALEEYDKQLLSTIGESGASGMAKIESIEELQKAVPQLEAGLKQIDEGISMLEKGLEELKAQKITVEEAIGLLNSQSMKASIEMSSALAEMAVASSALEEAQTTLDNAKEEALESADMNGILTIDTLSGLIVAQNFDMPAGYAYDGDTRYLIRVGKSVKSVEELEDLVLMDMGMDSVGLIRLSDVANIEVVDNSDETYAVVNGNPSVSLSFEKQTGYSTGEVTDRLLKKFKTLEAQNENLSITVLMNQGVYIDLVVDSVVNNMVVGAVLAVLVLILFLKDYRPLSLHCRSRCQW